MEFQLAPEEFWKRYARLNQKFSKKLVFHLGASAGLFSEINGMISAMVYYLKRGIGFQMYCGDANFTRDGKGWQSFFLPAVPECCESFHHHYNHRMNHLNAKNDFLKLLQAIPAVLLKRKYGFHYFTYELFDRILQENWAGRIIHCDDLNFSGSFPDAFALFAHYLWRLNQETTLQCEKLIRSLQLPKTFVAFQIRSGDKIVEAKLPPPDIYLQKATQLTTIRNAFILTDDYRIFEYLQQKWKNWQFHTLAEKSEKGYYIQQLQLLPDETFRLKHISLIASMELFRRAEYFIGSYFPNPCIFANALRCYKNNIFIDNSESPGERSNV